MYRDVTIAATFHKWPSEFFALTDDEQELLRFWFILRNEKERFGMLSKEDKVAWPYDGPAQEQ